MNTVFGMYGRYLFRLLVAGLFFGGIMAACDAEESCVSFATNEYQMGFYTFDEFGRPVASPFNFEQVEVIGSDSAFFQWSANGFNNLSLVLNPAADTTTFVFRYEEGRDTLRVTYERNFRMISPECGLEISYTDLNVFYHTFDSVRTITSELLRTDQGFDVAIYSLSPCESPYTNLFRLGFKSRNDDNEINPDIVNFETVQVAGNDSIYYSRTEEGTDRLNLALNPAADSTIFVFEGEEQIDTLVVRYYRNLRIYSPECGYEIQYLGLEVGRNTFDSVNLLSNSIPETNIQNFDVEIFRFE